MIRKISSIALLYLKTTFSSRSVFIFTILMPLLFTFVLGQAMDAMGSEEVATSWSLAVVDEDRSSLSRLLVKRLETNPVIDLYPTDRRTALADLEDHDRVAALIIPARFGATLGEGEAASLEFHQDAEQITKAQILEQSVTAASAELAGSIAVSELAVRVGARVALFEGADPEAIAAYKAQALFSAEEAWADGAPIRVQTQPVTRLSEAVVPLGASQSSPGMLVMYALFFTFGGGASLLVERDEGTLRRLLVMPMGKGTILTGKLLGIFLGGLLQMAIMVLAGQLFFGVQWGQSPLALGTMLLAYGFAGTALGLMVAALARTVAQANALGTILVMSLASLGGAWWPIEIVPAWMQKLALALPTGWAMRGFQDIITRGLGFDAVLLEAGVLLGFGLLFLLVGIWRFEYE